MLDCIIVGTGPAGLSAAINLKLHNKDFVWFGSRELSNKVRLAEKIANYPGFPLVTGEELAQRFSEHAREMGLEITEKMVSQIMPGKKGFTVLADNDIYDARCLILAPGVVSSRAIPGEEEMLGRGVSYCATCDGFLYKGKTIGVLCASPRFEHEVTYLAGLAQQVYLFTTYPDCAASGGNIRPVPGKIASIQGGLRLQSITTAQGEALALDGLFILRDAIAPSTLLPGLATEKGQILVDRTMATNIPGCYACGDCTGTPYQFTKAVGEGNVAAHSVLKRLAEMEKENG